MEGSSCIGGPGLQLGNTQAVAPDIFVFLGCSAAQQAEVHTWGWASGSFSLCFSSTENWELQKSLVFFFRRFLALFLQALSVNVSVRCSHKLWSAPLNCILLLLRCVPCHSRSRGACAAAARGPRVFCHPGFKEASSGAGGQPERSQCTDCPHSYPVSRHSSSHTALAGIVC